MFMKSQIWCNLAMRGWSVKRWPQRWWNARAWKGAEETISNPEAETRPAYKLGTAYFTIIIFCGSLVFASWSWSRHAQLAGPISNDRHLKCYQTVIPHFLWQRLCLVFFANAIGLLSTGYPRDEHQAEARERGRRESHRGNADSCVHRVLFIPFPYDPSPVLTDTRCAWERKAGGIWCREVPVGWGASFEVQMKYPLVNKHSYWKSPFLMGKLTINGHFQ